MGRKDFRCWKRWGHGKMDLDDAIIQSCDIYFYNTGKRLGIDRMAEASHKFGLGLPTGIDLLSEKPGLIPTTSWKEVQLGQKWIPGETISCSIGQGYVLVTPLQAALIPSIIANGGRLFRPQIVRRIESLDGDTLREFKPEEYANKVMEGREKEIVRCKRCNTCLLRCLAGLVPACPENPWLGREYAREEYKIGAWRPHESLLPEGLMRANMPALDRPWWKREMEGIEKSWRPLAGRTKR